MKLREGASGISLEQPQLTQGMNGGSDNNETGGTTCSKLAWCGESHQRQSSASDCLLQHTEFGRFLMNPGKRGIGQDVGEISMIVAYTLGVSRKLTILHPVDVEPAL